MLQDAVAMLQNELGKLIEDLFGRLGLELLRAVPFRVLI